MKTELREPDEYFLVGQDDPRLSIYLRYQLFKALEEFAKREHREQVGLLVGRASELTDGSNFVVVEDAIEAPVGDEQTGRFEEGLWKRARRIASARHPDRVVLGWFHTHPDGSMEIGEEERAVHRSHFPEENHLLYVISSKGQDRNFFLRQGQELVPAHGFRIYGKTPAIQASEEAVPGGVATLNTVAVSPEQQGRHIERNIEKIQQRLQNPPIMWKDYLIIALLVLNALLILFRPNPPVKVDTTDLEQAQADLSAQVSAVNSRMEKLDKHLGEIRMLDEQLKLAAGLEEIEIPEAPQTSEQTAQAADPKAAETGSLSGGQGMVKLYKVKNGDILGVLVEQFYPEAPEGTTRAFAQFNRLKGDAIFPGDTLKVPPLEALP